MIIINRDGIDYSFDDADAAIDFLKKGKEKIFKQEFSFNNDEENTWTFTMKFPPEQKRHNCNKCVWQYSNYCPGTKGYCDKYKKDPPDGGYYG